MTKLLQIHIATTSQGMEVVAAMLMELGHEQLEWMEDSQTVQRLLDQQADAWDYTDAAAIGTKPCGLGLVLPDNPQGHAELEDIRQGLANLAGLDLGLDLGSLAVSVTPTDDQDWTVAWRQSFPVTPIGNKWLLCPPWEQEPADNHRQVLRINPGLAFGTGQHQSTALCLQLMEQVPLAGARVLDCGCGSGILSIAALLEGAAYAMGVDVDPHAQSAVEDNAQLCGVQPGMAVLIGNLLQPQTAAAVGTGYDLLLCNIVADVVLAIIPRVKQWITPGAKLIFSGIVQDRLPEVLQALEDNGLTRLQVAESDEWRAVLAQG